MNFDNHGMADDYAARTARVVPGLADLHRMVAVLLAEGAGPQARILVLGAGGGLELRALATMQPEWTFYGVDPSAQMLDQARVVAADAMDRIALQQGYIDDAEDGPFDGAVCLLTLHFIPKAERLETLRQMHCRLRKGARIVTAQHSFADAEAALWLSRYAAFTGGTAEGAMAIRDKLPILSPAQDKALLEQAGFKAVQQFYSAFTFKGFTGTA